jgi:hypothetical protein
MQGLRPIVRQRYDRARMRRALPNTIKLQSAPAALPPSPHRVASVLGCATPVHECGTTHSAMSPHVACCVLRVACCVLRVACCVLRVACCVLRVACCVLRVSRESSQEKLENSRPEEGGRHWGERIFLTCARRLMMKGSSQQKTPTTTVRASPQSSDTVHV